LIECVANLSEGCDAAAIAGMAAAVRSAGARLLDIHSDGDHNRSVFTFVGTAPETESSAVRLACEAVSRIDLRRHRGVHPRIGALDVVPFVPLDGSSMSECVGVARRVGAAIAERTGVPVFLYGRAAVNPARSSLAALRRGGLDALRRRIGSEGWTPDFGPSRLHPTAGATAVGARPLLVAYNILLDSADLGMGRRIAFAARGVNGGPRGVQALAFFLDGKGCVQISMNLTDVEATSVLAAFQRVSDLAASHGVRVASSEIVGLAPRRALAGATARDLRLADRLEGHILEERLENG
jgi:glutamate formiminotransferase/formiminotetrahydrofolate cyclodeaminase